MLAETLQSTVRDVHVRHRARSEDESLALQQTKRVCHQETVSTHETQGGGSDVLRAADVKGEEEDEIARLDRGARTRYVRDVC